MAVLVLGLGNLLMSDDGLGPRIAARLSDRYPEGSGVRVVDGGTLGLDLLPLLEGVERLLIVDALDLGATPGAIFRLAGEEVPRAFANKLSVHQMGLQDLLAVAALQGHFPAELVVWGAQAGSLDVSTDLTPPVAAAVEPLLVAVRAELKRWGIEAAAPPVAKD